MLTELPMNRRIDNVPAVDRTQDLAIDPRTDGGVRQRVPIRQREQRRNAAPAVTIRLGCVVPGQKSLATLLSVRPCALRASAAPDSNKPSRRSLSQWQRIFYV